MYKIIIVCNAEVKEGGLISASLATERMVAALKKAISVHSPQSVQLEVIPAAYLWSNYVTYSYSTYSDYPENDVGKIIYCPLTIQLPDNFIFPQHAIYKACRDVQGLRTWVEDNFGYKTSIGEHWLGDLWLPIVWTAKGPLYAEVIGEGVVPNSYQQPIDLTDYQRRSLYELAYQLLEHLSAPPTVYLLQFRFVGQEIVFDRLWPFPAAPALASVGVQKPDLFTCHWFCLTEQPIFDVTIANQT